MWAFLYTDVKHSSALNCDTIMHVLFFFSVSSRVVAVDQRGYGDSDKPSSVYDYRLPMLVNDLKELIIALGKANFMLISVTFVMNQNNLCAILL